MTERIELSKPSSETVPDARKRPWHAPQFNSLEIWSTEAKAGTPSDGKPTQS